LNQSKIFLTCDSIYKFPVLKYFEALSCGALLLAPGSTELEQLGFKDGETFVEVNETNFLQKATYYLSHDQERNRITENGLKFIQERHTTEVRAKQLITHIRRIIGLGEENET
jgi:spore maturation protein CgeB